jgi:hypothetical protein
MNLAVYGRPISYYLSVFGGVHGELARVDVASGRLQAAGQRRLSGGKGHLIRVAAKIFRTDKESC